LNIKKAILLLSPSISGGTVPRRQVPWLE